MPNIKSAKKRLRSDASKRMVNRVRKTRVRNSEKKLQAAVAAGDLDGAQALLSQCFRELDRAAKKGTIHRNQASRKKHRLSALLRRSAG